MVHEDSFLNNGNVTRHASYFYRVNWYLSVHCIVAEFMLKLILISSAHAAVKHGTIFLWNRDRESEGGGSQMECILQSRDT